jgi:PAS domain S-box-containing protein
LEHSTVSFDAGQRAVLERIATGVGLADVLESIVLLIEQQSEGMLCSILLLDDEQRLRHGAAPHLPAAYRQAIDGSKIGPNAGSCGTAAYAGERVIVEDIATHPYWENYRQLAVPFGLKACWSTPIRGTSDEVIGTFAMYYPQPRTPTAREIELVDAATHLASIAILRDRTQEELRRSEARARDLARLHAVSSSINKLIMRARDSQNLVDVACQIPVQKGLARLAWLGMMDEEKHRIEILAQFGDVAPLPQSSIDLNDPSNAGGLAERAMQTGEPSVSGDLFAEAPEHWRSVLLERGLRSCALFPLKDRDRTIGIFTLYAAQPDYFREEELQVLTALAADISFALESTRREVERQQMEEAMRASENLRALIFSTVGDPIFYIDCETDDRYRFMSINRAFSELFGVDESQVIGRYLNDTLPDSTREAVLERYRHACQTRSRISWEQIVTARTGIKHVELTIAPIFDARGVCSNFVGTVHDITARIQAEEERAQLVTQLNQAQRMQALGTLAGGIAHDFNNILAAISGNASLALQEDSAETPTKTHLLEIQKASQRAIALVRQILAFSRHAPPKREMLEPVEVVREALNLLRVSLPQTIAIETQFAADIPNVEGDSTQLHQIVMNLGTNAAYALPERGGVICFKVDAKRVADGEHAGASVSAGEYLRLQVIDNGKGMDEATLKRAFDPFFTTRQPGEGTGLGLSVVHGIVQSHRGVVEIRSRVDEGTTVVVLLPAAAGRAQQVTGGAPAKGHGERVMYVDDEEALVFLMDRALTKMGFRVSGFSEPTAALNAFRARPDDFDVVVTDVSMPGMSGPDLAAEIRGIRPEMPIVMTSGYIRPEDVQSAERLRINQLVYKANTIEELGQVLAREIDALSSSKQPGS